MADIKGLGGLNTSLGTNKLIAAYGNDLIDVDTGSGYGVNLTSTNDVNFESYLDSLFFQNFADRPKSFNGTSWTTKHLNHVPLAKYIKLFNERLYLGYIKINSTTYASRVWYSNLPVVDNAGNFTIQWGFQSGTNGSVVANTNRFRAAFAGFQTYGLKVGDPLIVESGANAGQYRIARISDDQMVEIVGTFKTTQSNITYWAGSNWFDVRTNNSDVVTSLSENSNNLLIFKNDTLHRYNLTSLKTVRGLGTTSNRSVVFFPGRDINIYFHGSTADKTGFYMDNGRESLNISRKIQPFMDAISSSNYNSVVAWNEGDTYRAFVGNISNQNSSNDSYNISDSNVVYSYSIVDNSWKIDPIADVITASCHFRESNVLKVFLGNDSGEVFLTPSGYSFDGDPIRFNYQTRTLYPRGSEVVNIFTRIKVVARDASRVSVYYKLWGTPFDIDQTWTGLGNLTKDTTEFQIPSRHNKGCGIQLAFMEMGTKEPVQVIEKISIYSVGDSVDTPENRELT